MAIHQDDIYILDKGIMPYFIVGNVILYILNVTVIAHRYIVQGCIIYSRMFGHSTSQSKLFFKNAQSHFSRKTGVMNIIRMKIIGHFYTTPIGSYTVLRLQSCDFFFCQ